MNDVTRILSAIEQGDPQAAERLLPAGLRRAAQAGRPAGWPRRSPARRSRPPPWSTRPTSGWSAPTEPGAGTAAATSSPPRPRRCAASWSTTPAARRARSAAAAAGASSSTLVDLAGRAAPADDLLALDEALDRLAAEDPQAAELVKLRYFAGLTIEEAAEALGISPAHRRPPLGLRPRLARSPARAAASRTGPRSRNLRESLDGSGPGSRIGVVERPDREADRWTPIARAQRRSSIEARRDRDARPERAAYLDEACAGATPELRGAGRGRCSTAHERRRAASSRPPARSAPGRRHARSTRPAASPRRPGTVIGPYKLLEQIGEGGMGVGLHGRADRARSAARSP